MILTAILTGRKYWTEDYKIINPIVIQTSYPPRKEAVRGGFIILSMITAGVIAENVYLYCVNILGGSQIVGKFSSSCKLITRLNIYYIYWVLYNEMKMR